MELISCRTCIHYSSQDNTCGGDSNICLQNPNGVSSEWMKSHYANWPREDCRFLYIYWEPRIDIAISLPVIIPDFLSDKDFEI